MGYVMTDEELKRYFPNASASCIRRNQADAGRVCANHEKPTQGYALVSAAPRKGKGRKGAVLGATRCRIQFRVFSQRPADWDGYSVKEIQDCLVHAGLLDEDGWDILSGEVISEKAYSAESCRTEILIERLP